jgi:hypothetical protein
LWFVVFVDILFVGLAHSYLLIDVLMI